MSEERVEHFVEVNGVRLCYELSGQGRPVVLLHGNGEDHRIFDESVAVLRGQYSCYALDSRGHGRSTPTERFVYGQMARDVCEFLRALHLRDVCLVGFSDGGIIGLLAAQQTSRITSLVVCGANLRPWGIRPQTLREIFEGYHRSHDPLLWLMLTQPQIPAHELSGIRARTLVLAGENDLILPSQTQKIARHIPGAELCVLPGEGHETYIVHSPRLGELVRAFLAEERAEP